MTSTSLRFVTVFVCSKCFERKRVAADESSSCGFSAATKLGLCVPCVLILTLLEEVTTNLSELGHFFVFGNSTRSVRFKNPCYITVCIYSSSFTQWWGTQFPISQLDLFPGAPNQKTLTSHIQSLFPNVRHITQSGGCISKIDFCGKYRSNGPGDFDLFKVSVCFSRSQKVLRGNNYLLSKVQPVDSQKW